MGYADGVDIFDCSIEIFHVLGRDLPERAETHSQHSWDGLALLIAENLSLWHPSQSASEMGSADSGESIDILSDPEMSERKSRIDAAEREADKTASAYIMFFE